MAFSIAIVLLVLMFGGGRKRSKRSVTRGAHATSSSAAENPSTYRAYYDDTPTRIGFSDFNVRTPGIFRTDDAQSRYNNLFHHCTVIGERTVRIADFPNSLVGRVIRERGWQNLTSYDVHPNVSLVREFYANIDPYFVESNYIHCYVRTKFFHISPQSLSRYFNAPVVVNPQFPYSPENFPSLSTVATLLTGGEREWDGLAVTLKHSDLTQDFAILHVFVSANIYPVLHTSNVNKEKAVIMYALATNASMDLGSYIFKLIVNAFDNSKKSSSLPFGSLITSLCKSFRVEEHASDVIGSLGPPYNVACLNKRITNINRVRRANANVGVNVENAQGEVPPQGDVPPVPPPQDAYSMEAMWNLMMRMDGKMDEMHGMFGTLREEMNYNHRSTAERLDGIEHQMNYFHDYGGSSRGRGNYDDDNDDDGNDDGDGME